MDSLLYLKLTPRIMIWMLVSSIAMSCNEKTSSNRKDNNTSTNNQETNEFGSESDEDNNATEEAEEDGKGGTAIMNKFPYRGITADEEDYCIYDEIIGLRCWGQNYWNNQTISQVSIIYPEIANRKIIQVSGASLPCLLFENKEVFCLTNLEAKHVKEDGITRKFVKIKLDEEFTPVQLASDTGMGCVLSEFGEVRCWGYTDNIGIEHESDKIYGFESTVPIDFGIDVKAKKIFGHYNRGWCALLSSGSVKCFSSNAVGGKILKFIKDLPIIDMSTLLNRGCVAFSDGTVSCWNDNTGTSKPDYGLGLGEVKSIASSEVPFTVPLGTDKKVVRVSLGYTSSCAIFEDGSVKCWGMSVMSTLQSASNPIYVGRTLDEMGDALPFVEFDDSASVVDIKIALDVLVYLSNGRFKYFGADSDEFLANYKIKTPVEVPYIPE